METYLKEIPVSLFIFIVTIITSLYAWSNEYLLDKLMLHPASVYHGKRVYTVITSGLIHADWMHLIFNMMSYCFFAFNLERLIGHWQFGLLYMVSMVLSDMPSVIKHKDDYHYRTLGASGAISAVIFSFIMYFPLVPMYIYFAIPIKAIFFGILYLIYCAYASRQSRDGINHDAHFFGAVCGIVITILLNHQVLPDFVHQLTGGGN